MAAMAKPVELVTTFSREEWLWLMEQLEHPRRNKAWERTLREARKVRLD